jgi:hypothetical protein
MPFIIIGLFLIFTVSFLLGKFFSPKDSSIKVVLQKGFYYLLILAIALGVIAGIVALVDNYLDDKRKEERAIEQKAEEEKRVASLPALRKSLPNPNSEDIKTILLNWSFPENSMPCLSTYERLNFESLQDIISVQTTKTSILNDLYEVLVEGEFLVNKPKSNFHFKSVMAFQYVFEDGDEYGKVPGWSLNKIIINSCEQLPAISLNGSINESISGVVKSESSDKLIGDWYSKDGTSATLKIRRKMNNTFGYEGHICFVDKGTLTLEGQNLYFKDGNISGTLFLSSDQKTITGTINCENLLEETNEKDVNGEPLIDVKREKVYLTKRS